jgi:hypothetical protein
MDDLRHRASTILRPGRRNPLVVHRSVAVGFRREKDLAMMVGLKRISAAFGLMALVSASAPAQAPAPAGQNQATANAVASALKSSKTLSSYRIEIETREGLVTLTGAVPNVAQKQEAIALANRVPGVSGVVDQIKLIDGRVRPAQYQVAFGGHGHHGGGGEVMGAPSYEGAPIVSQPVGAPDGGPIPEGPAGGPAVGSTSMPNYAWPSYAPNQNFSAVGYPTAYPWQAWPNIGPFYPYPEVPQEWRAVTLRWDDGIWWLDFKKNYTRPFFTPYPFGLFAY